MAEGLSPIILGPEFTDYEGERKWPLRIELAAAYREVCAEASNFRHETPKEALLSGLRSGRIRAVRGRLRRTIRKGLQARFVERQFDEECVPPQDWANCSAFNPLDGTMNDASGRVVSPIEVYSSDLLHWMRDHGSSVDTHECRYVSEELAIFDWHSRREFEDKYVLASGSITKEKRGRPRVYRWDRAIANVLVEEFYLNPDAPNELDRAYLVGRLYDEFGDYDDGGPASSGVQEFADMILESIAACRQRREAFRNSSER